MNAEQQAAFDSFLDVLPKGIRVLPPRVPLEERDGAGIALVYNRPNAHPATRWATSRDALLYLLHKFGDPAYVYPNACLKRSERFCMFSG